MGSDLGMLCDGSSLLARGEKSTWIEAVELELDFLRRKMLSDRSLASSASPLRIVSPIIE